jgi:hypothetical protein
VAHIGPFAGYSTYKCCFFGTPALVYIRYPNPLATKLRLVLAHMMPKIYPLVQQEAVRLELSRAVEEYNAELKKQRKNYLEFFE